MFGDLLKDATNAQGLADIVQFILGMFGNIFGVFNGSKLVLM